MTRTSCNVLWGAAMYAIAVQMMTTVLKTESAPDDAVLQDISRTWPSLSTLSCNAGLVNCDDQGRVTELILHGVDPQLTGSIPSSIGNLSELTRLELQNNHLTGGIPDSFANLKKLKILNLLTNNLSGSIPEFLGNLSLSQAGGWSVIWNQFTSYPLSLQLQFGYLPVEFNCIPGLPASAKQRGAKECPNLATPPTLSPPRVPTAVGTSPPSNSSSFQWWWAVLPALALALASILSVFLWWRRRKAKARQEELPEEQLGAALESTYSLSSLRSMTDNFSDSKLLGRGGFGSVYRGHVAGAPVAVKRLFLSEDDRSGSDREQFLNEVKILSQLRHKNLVTLQGYCCQAGERILVTDYINNGSLADNLFRFAKLGLEPLHWPARCKIATETAEALHYLHALSGQKTQVLHRDMKADNILLDRNFSPFICDFGIARLSKQTTGKTGSTTGDVVGTRGYMAPEWLLFGRLSEKIDVYSFGVILLELLTGKQSITAYTQEDGIPEAEDLVPLQVAALAATCQPDLLPKLIDPAIRGEVSLKEDVMPIFRVAMLCVLYDARRRPTMQMVVSMLQSKLAIPNIPKNPYAWSWQEAMSLPRTGTDPAISGAV